MAADVSRGGYQPPTKIMFNDYAAAWVERHHGTGSGFRETTRDGYRQNLTKYAVPFLHGRRGRTVTGVTPLDLAEFGAWLADEEAQGRRLADSTIRNVLNHGPGLPLDGHP